MKLSRANFEQRFEACVLKFAFIGMSNIGKSYTAQKLASIFNFTVIEIDNLIWENLGYESMAEFAAWQGQPYSEGYADREARSIAIERQALLSAIQAAEGNIILDTPGSVIYTGDEALTALKKNFLIVHIKATSQDLERLKEDYFDNPKPLIWDGYFKSHKGLSNKEAILKCYPDLLQARAMRYEALADVTIDSDFILNPANSPQDIFDTLKPPR